MTDIEEFDWFVNFANLGRALIYIHKYMMGSLDTDIISTSIYGSECLKE